MITRLDALEELSAQLADTVDQLARERFERVSASIRAAHEADVLANLPELTASARWIKATDSGWALVKRDDDQSVVSLPSFLKVSLTNNAGGRDYITVLEGPLIGLKANLAAGFLVAADPQHGAVTVRFRPRAGGSITIGGIVYDKEIVLNFQKAGAAVTVGPHPALTDASNPAPAGTHVVQIPDYPHAANSDYGPLRTVWFRIGTSGDRYIHPGRVSAGCITCYPGNWAAIYDGLARGRSNTTEVGTVIVS